MTTTIPRHLADAPTWSAMLAGWSTRHDPAVAIDNATWSGIELLERAAGAAARLTELTSRPGPVPALVTSTPAAIAFVIGGAECGRPLAPLGPRLTTYELGPCVDGLGSDLLLAEAEFAPLAEELAHDRGMRVAILDDPPRAAAPLAFRADPLATAFVLHTSGTTGDAKAVPYRQDRLAHRVRVNAGLCALGPGCVYASASPFHHIAGLGNYAVALAAGASLAPVARFTVEAWKALAELRVTHALTVPTVLEVLLDAGALTLPDLRTLQYGGSPIHPDTLIRLLDALPDIDLVNIFGQTEGSPITCLTPEDHRQIARSGRHDLLTSVGRAAPHVEVRIEIGDGETHDAIGEVVARADHFFLVDDDTWLRSGDLGHIDADGYLFLAGRRGDKIIRGGENIYPVEVEQVIARHPAVRDVGVVGVPDPHWGEVVRAVIVPTDPAAPPDPEELRAHTRAFLAGFKVPTEWDFSETLPRNAGGKLLRRRLLPTPPTNQ